MPRSRSLVAPSMFECVSIIGVGLIGGSIGMSIRKRGLARKVIGIGRHPEKLKLAQRLGAIDSWTVDISKGLKNSDLVLLCIPPSPLPGIVKQVSIVVKPGTIVTDVTGVKVKPLCECEKILSSRNILFVGSHPLAGSEKSGVKYASQDLFEGHNVLLVQNSRTNKMALNKVKKLWDSVGASVSITTPQEHDRQIALFSQLPHLFAALLMSKVSEDITKNPQHRSFLTPSLKDMTRIAASDPELWAELFNANSIELVRVLKSTIDELNGWMEDIGRGKVANLKRKFKRASEFRRKLEEIACCPTLRK